MFIQLCILSFLQASLMLSEPSQAEFLDNQSPFDKIKTPSPTSQSPNTIHPNRLAASTVFPNPSPQETPLASDNNTSQQHNSNSPSTLPIAQFHPFGHSGANKDGGGDDDGLSVNKRDVHGQLFPIQSTDLPSTTIKPSTLPVTSTRPQTSSTGGGSFNRHRRDEFPTQKPSLPSTPGSTLRPQDSVFHGRPLIPQTSTVQPDIPSTIATTANLPGIFNRHRRESPTAPPFPPFFNPQQTSSSSTSQPGERDTRLFFSLTTRDPSDNSTTTTRRSFFNRNRPTSSEVTVGPDATSTRRFFFSHNDESTPTTSKSLSERFPIFGHEQVTSSSTFNPLGGERVTSTDEPTSTTRRFGFNRFRRNSHEFPPEEDEEQFGQSHVTTSRVPSSTKMNIPSTTSRFGFSRFRRNSHEFPPEEDEEQFGQSHVTTSRVPSSTKMNIPNTTSRFGFSRFRRNSHEFPPEEDEEQFGQSHVTASRVPSSTKKNIPSRNKRSRDDDDDDSPFRRRTTTTERDTNERSTTRESHGFFGHVGHFNGDESIETSSIASTTQDHSIFHVGHSNRETTESTSTTERQLIGGHGRFRRSDRFDSDKSTPFPRRTTSTVQPSTTKEEINTSTIRQPVRHFHV